MYERDQSNDQHQTERLRLRIERLESDRRKCDSLDGFSRLYAGVSVAVIVLSFFPLYDRSVDEDAGITWSYGSIWEILDQDQTGASTIGVLLMVGLASMLGIAAFGRVTESIALLVSIAVTGGLIAVMVVTKPGTPDPKPDIAYGGQAGLAVILLAVAIALAHGWLIIRARPRSR